MNRINRSIAIVVAVTLGAALAACASDSGADTSVATDTATTDAADTVPGAGATSAIPTTASPTTASPTTATPTTTPITQPPTTDVNPSDAPMGPAELVAALASDDLGGRDNGTAYSVAAQQVLIGQLRQFAEPAMLESAGDDGFLQPFDAGTNVVAVIPGGDLADEWVVIGAHYDHIGNDCPTSDPADHICNGATDNAAGVAVAIEAARAVASAGTPRRSVLVGFWDAEEDGLLGSEAYLADPVVPVESTVAYINFDIQGANLLPATATSTVMVGAETGGAPLIDAALRATRASTLDTLPLSLLFGQGRSDHANFVEAGVPSVFFTDANNACYHTAQDALDVVDFDKLDQQILTASALAADLVATDDPPVFDPAAPPTTFDDAAALYALITKGEEDLVLLTPDGQAAAEQYIVDLGAVVAAGPDAFDDEAVGIVLSGAVDFVDALTQGVCSGYVAE